VKVITAVVLFQSNLFRASGLLQSLFCNHGIKTIEMCCKT